MTISDEDKALFRAAVDALGKNTASQSREPEKETRLIGLEIDQWAEVVSAEDHLCFVRESLSHTQMSDLKQGRVAIEQTLDFHGMTLQQAEDALENLLNQDHKKIRLIHGKGQNALLKNAVNRWLRAHPRVLAFASCPPSQGGTGAMNVILTRKR
ncbi:MAG: DNA mismatch repair protein MutS [Gammaproteobacteria bacterium CG11_big_fil_rev_8_21_14_0_20_46_22]|nr:MAG: DNA mismatch repair protein MutS [Gammaproteobacteria bacterium CG12_big_fil_rev_8_21_14_0_65_46_12]PIR10767.1 MAG: DNA mismatch repair protein MutS [Gammaproteobacteria bacterium CG11_big_fil_rev_8_21_14_0_20_46_22]